MRNLVMAVMASSVYLLATSGVALSMSNEMCYEDEKCTICREDVNCQNCYYKCANKYGEIKGDINFAYRLSEKELRALKCYKACWGEEVDVSIKQTKPVHNSANKSYHKKRD